MSIESTLSTISTALRARHIHWLPRWSVGTSVKARNRVMRVHTAKKKSC